MARHLFTRRRLLAGFATTLAATLATRPAFAADDPTQLDWPDLLPPGAHPQMATPRGIVGHDGASLLRQQPPSSGVRKELDGKLVRLPGYIVPLEFDGAALKTFLLAPYVGACIHVPPPPANQLVLISAEQHPYEASDFYSAIAVTGVLEIASISSDLADIGYAMQARQIDPYATH